MKRSVNAVKDSSVKGRKAAEEADTEEGFQGYKYVEVYLSEQLWIGNTVSRRSTFL